MITGYITTGSHTKIEDDKLRFIAMPSDKHTQKSVLEKEVGQKLTKINSDKHNPFNNYAAIQKVKVINLEQQRFAINGSKYYYGY